MHTACVFVVGKNYRLQDIQLSKINLGGVAPQTPRSLTRGNPLVPLRSLAKAQSLSAALKPRNRLRPRLVGAPPKRRAAGRGRQTTKRWTSARGDQTASPTHRELFKDRWPSSGLPIRLRASRSGVMVENTGLEPVTSWLQTRRSPS